MGNWETFDVRSVMTMACLAGGLAGCAAYGLQQRQARLAPLVGQSEATLVRQFGVPTRTYDVGSTKFLAYDERSTEVIPGSPGFGPWGWWDWGGFAPEVVERTCETTVEVDGGQVRSFSLRGNACG